MSKRDLTVNQEPWGRLLVCKQKEGKPGIKVIKAQCKIGSAPSNQIRIRNMSAAPEQARIFKEGNDVFIEKLADAQVRIGDIELPRIGSKKCLVFGSLIKVGPVSFSWQPYGLPNVPPPLPITLTNSNRNTNTNTNANRNNTNTNANTNTNQATSPTTNITANINTPAKPNNAASIQQHTLEQATNKRKREEAPDNQYKTKLQNTGPKTSPNSRNTASPRGQRGQDTLKRNTRITPSRSRPQQQTPKGKFKRRMPSPDSSLSATDKTRQYSTRSKRYRTEKNPSVDTSRSSDDDWYSYNDDDGSFLSPTQVFGADQKEMDSVLMKLFEETKKKQLTLNELHAAWETTKSYEIVSKEHDNTMLHLDFHLDSLPSIYRRISNTTWCLAENAKLSDSPQKGQALSDRRYKRNRQGYSLDEIKDTAPAVGGKDGQDITDTKDSSGRRAGKTEEGELRREEIEKIEDDKAIGSDVDEVEEEAEDEEVDVDCGEEASDAEMDEIREECYEIYRSLEPLLRDYVIYRKKVLKMPVGLTEIERETPSAVLQLYTIHGIIADLIRHQQFLTEDKRNYSKRLTEKEKIFLKDDVAITWKVVAPFCPGNKDSLKCLFARHLLDRKASKEAMESKTSEKYEGITKDHDVAL